MSDFREGRVKCVEQVRADKVGGGGLNVCWDFSSTEGWHHNSHRGV